MNYIKILNKKLKTFFHQYGMVISLVLSIAAVALSGYSVYLIKNSPRTNVPGSAPTPKLSASDMNQIVKGGATVIGNADAKVTIVEFADFQCPFCGKFFKDVLPMIKSQYVDTGKARFVFMNFAFLGEESKLASQAAKCAQDQGKFWEYHDYLFDHQQGENLGAFSSDNLKKFASTLKLNSTSFDQCLDGKKYEKAVDEEVETGRKFGVNGTPGTFINEFFIKGAQDKSYFANRIDEALK